MVSVCDLCIKDQSVTPFRSHRLIESELPINPNSLIDSLQFLDSPEVLRLPECILYVFLRIDWRRAHVSAGILKPKLLYVKVSAVSVPHTRDRVVHVVSVVRALQTN